jgi:hypothetical protein
MAQDRPITMFPRSFSGMIREKKNHFCQKLEVLSWVWGLIAIIPAIQEAENGRIAV